MEPGEEYDAFVRAAEDSDTFTYSDMYEPVRLQPSTGGNK